MAKKSNDLLISELTAKYQVLADIDMKKHKDIVIHITVFDQREMADHFKEEEK